MVLACLCDPGVCLRPFFFPCGHTALLTRSLSWLGAQQLVGLLVVNRPPLSLALAALAGPFRHMHSNSGIIRPLLVLRNDVVYTRNHGRPLFSSHSASAAASLAAYRRSQRRFKAHARQPVARPVIVTYVWEVTYFRPGGSLKRWLGSSIFATFNFLLKVRLCPIIFGHQLIFIQLCCLPLL